MGLPWAPILVHKSFQRLGSKTKSLLFFLIRNCSTKLIWYGEQCVLIEGKKLLFLVAQCLGSPSLLCSNPEQRLASLRTHLWKAEGSPLRASVSYSPEPGTVCFYA